VARLHRVGDPPRREGRRVPRARPPAHLGLDAVAELTHFACTSEDINSASYALTVKRAVENVWLPKLRAVIDALAALAHEHRDAAMLSRTHGQPATPSTMGKELAVFAWRLERVAAQIAGGEYLAKFSGATGTWSAHLAAAPDVDWPELSRAFIEGLGIDFNVLTTQIESHDWQVELYDRVRHAGGILHNLATDIWTYIAMGFFAQIPVAGATGSSTMPHKINPIRFENAEANFEISGGLFTTLASTLVTSRMQRDLTDSTTQRNIGVAFGHSLLARQPAARAHRDLALARRAAGRPRRELGGARRGDPDGGARGDRRGTVADHRPLRPAEGAHARTPRRRPRAGGVRAHARHRRGRQGAPAGAHAGRYTGLADELVDRV
jgi:adenylosuccinate lyase